MCGISAILYTPCQGVGSQGCRFHTDLKHTFIFGQWKPGVSVVQTKDAVKHKRNILTLLSATCYVCTSVHRLLMATYSHPRWWGLLEPIPVLTEQDTSTHLLDRLPVHCRAHTALSHTQRTTKSKEKRPSGAQENTNHTQNCYKMAVLPSMSRNAKSHCPKIRCYSRCYFCMRFTGVSLIFLLLLPMRVTRKQLT